MMKSKVMRAALAAGTSAALVLGGGAVASANPKVRTTAIRQISAASNVVSVKGDTFALINGDNADPFFFSIWAGAIAGAKKYGIKIIEQAPTTFDYTQQLSLLDDELAKHVNGIIFSPDSVFGFAQFYQQAHAAGIPVVDVNDTEAQEKNNPNVLSFAGSSSIPLGALAAQAMAKLVGGKGLVTVINSIAGGIGDVERGSGFLNKIKASYPKMRVLAEQYDMDDVSKADQIATDEMQANPSLEGIYGVDSFTGQGVGTAVKAAGKAGKVKVVAIDAEPQEVALMKQGVIQALIAQQPYEMGVTGVQNIVLALEGKTSHVVRSLILGPIMVTPQNLNTPYIQTVIYPANEP
jgi:ribose transport system substrate-binding protein